MLLNVCRSRFTVVYVLIVVLFSVQSLLCRDLILDCKSSYFSRCESFKIDLLMRYEPYVKISKSSRFS